MTCAAAVVSSNCHPVSIPLARWFPNFFDWLLHRATVLYTAYWSGFFLRILLLWFPQLPMVHILGATTWAYQTMGGESILLGCPTIETAKEAGTSGSFKMKFFFTPPYFWSGPSNNFLASIVKWLLSEFAMKLVKELRLKILFHDH